MEHTQSKEELIKENSALKNELNDLKLIIEAVTGHSDGIESELLEKIHAGEKLFQVMSKTIPVPFFISLKDSGKILFSNKHAYQIFGYSAEVFLTKEMLDLYSDPKEFQTFITVLSQYGQVDNFEATLKKSDNSLLIVYLFSQPIVFKEQACLLTVIYDLTERIKAEEEKSALENQLRQTQKMEAIGTMAGGISHDLNNILAIIFGNIELSMMILPEDNEVQKLLTCALSAAKRAKEMVKQILDFCRQKEHERIPVKIKQVVSEAVGMIKELMPSTIQIKLEIEPQLSTIQGDPTQIHQILMNLCSNSAYAMRDTGGVIEIILKEVHKNLATTRIANPKPVSYVVLTVKDTGCGIEKTIMDRIFDPFFTTKPVGKGTGLGLSVVYGIIKSFGGTITVESELGKGAAFHCYFPLSSKTSDSADPTDIQKKVNGGKEKILLVDDEEDVLLIFKSMIESLGYEVITHSNSLQALQMVQKSKNDVDLVVTDNMMPNMMGTTLAEKILAIRPNMPIILCTGLDIQINKDHLSSIGIKGFINKPYSLQQLAFLIRKLLDERNR
ncbi:MAG: response regulator [Desulfobacterales bacterium]|nr:response regulator [Desulfobacterales bacterium]